MHLLSSIIRLLDYGCRHKTIRNAKIFDSCLRRNFIAWNLAPGIFLENKGGRQDISSWWVLRRSGRNALCICMTRRTHLKKKICLSGQNIICDLWFIQLCVALILCVSIRTWDHQNVPPGVFLSTEHDKYIRFLSPQLPSIGFVFKIWVTDSGMRSYVAL